MFLVSKYNVPKLQDRTHLIFVPLRTFYWSDDIKITITFKIICVNKSPAPWGVSVHQERGIPTKINKDVYERFSLFFKERATRKLKMFRVVSYFETLYD